MLIIYHAYCLFSNIISRLHTVRSQAEPPRKHRICRKRRRAFFSSSSLQKERSEKVLHIVVAIVVMRRVFPILQRGHAVKFLEFPAEIVRIRIAGLVGNLADIAIWIHAQKLTRVVHPHFRQIPGDRHLKEKTEKLHQPRPAYIGIPDDLRHRERRIVVLLNEFNRPEQRRRIPGDPDVVLDMTLQAQNQKIGQRLHRINHVFPRQLLNVGKPAGNDRSPRTVNLPETVQSADSAKDQIIGIEIGSPSALTVAQCRRHHTD